MHLGLCVCTSAEMCVFHIPNNEVVYTYSLHEAGLKTPYGFYPMYTASI